MKVRPKKHLGQHFLRDVDIARQIVALLSHHNNYRTVLEIGPGMGVLTQFLLQNEAYQTHVVELDRESVVYLKKHFPALENRIYAEDFLKMDLEVMVKGEGLKGKGENSNLITHNSKLITQTARATPSNIAIIGNFPYNISSQILFKVLEHRDLVPEVVGMFQKEVAQRIASKPGGKEYGILSVLMQAFYDIEYAFTVPPESFDPPPKVQSGVIRLKRNDVMQLDCDEKRFVQVVKTAFNQRRKTLRNALKPLGTPFEHPLLDLRAERLSVADFVLLTQMSCGVESEE
ncbi:MAG: ribosomal RNA small subunit methyltransferase A [Cytophagia bacterium]|nr:MAG: ribosomal RNA small subunit methyltransferase A [Cytophagales bacterium]TAG39958.1 MAG: ribosomal RNA small subunit methyltransferase A [Cytophagia bacterium]TAG58273.1 MAG: ribosomal RNA small subunit methyltransferase A [Runella slithyformis]TAG70116.1 MAG: ribosomal RNA small subunit methyltransferase A [Runella slithyformis]TAG81697.1 MAG: ribosomal RNA small subunit methyltransferase A [Cytophagales bacterium]